MTTPIPDIIDGEARIAEIQSRLADIAGRFKRSATAWKMKASTYNNDVSFLFSLVTSLDKTRVALAEKLEAAEKKAAELEAGSPLLYTATGDRAPTIHSS